MKNLIKEYWKVIILLLVISLVAIISGVSIATTIYKNIRENTNETRIVSVEC